MAGNPRGYTYFSLDDDVARILVNIADLYRKTGRTKEAKAMEKRAAAIQATGE
jgi:hypothetical protein